MTLLYIDDDDDDVRFLFEAMQLVNGSCKCIPANGGVQGLKLLKNLVPDYIFLDVNMPEMSGREILQQIRLDEKLNDAKVVIFTTYLDQEDISHYKADGATHCLVKPSSFSQLMKALEKIFRIHEES